MRRLTQAEREQLVEDYQRGMTVYALADRYGIHRHTVSSHLRAGGIRLRLDGLSSEQEAEAVRLYASGQSMARLADRFGVATKTILSCLRRHGVRTRDSHGRER